MNEDRRLAAIMFTDIVGYTALMGSDEDKAFKVLRKNREIQRPIIKKYRGECLKEMGDGILASFHTASDAVRCAGEIQQAVKEEGIGLRIGIHEGEVVFEGGDVLGDGVNVASRLEEFAEEGCINISGAVYSNIKNKAGIRTEFIEEKKLKNVYDPIRVYKVLSDEEVDKQGGKERKSTKPQINILRFILYGLGIAIIVIFLIWKFIPFKENIVLEKSIAVRPFWNESDDPENEYFVNGMCEEIRTHLSKIADLKVFSRGSVEKYKDLNYSNWEIAQDLGVTYVLEGTVQKIGNTVRIHAQLILGEYDDHIWAESYTKDITDIAGFFNVQSQIAQSVAKEIEAIVTPDEKQRIEKIYTENQEAYDLFLRGREYHRQYNPADHNIAINFYQQAIELDPEFALAYVWLGAAILAKNYVSEYTREDFGDTSLYLINKALSIDPDLSDAYYVRAGYWISAKGEVDLAIEDLIQATKLNPNDAASYNYLGKRYTLTGKYIDAIININKSQRLSIGTPIYSEALTSLGQLYGTIGYYEKAKQLFIEQLKYDPQFGYIGLYKLSEWYGEFDNLKLYTDAQCEIDSGTDCLFRLGTYSMYTLDFKAAKKYYDKCMKDSANNWYLFDIGYRYGYILDNLGEEDAGMKHFNLKIEEYKKEISEKVGLLSSLGYTAYYLAGIYSYTNDIEKAFEILHDMEKQGMLGNWILTIKIDPLYQNLREEEAFKSLADRQEKKFAEIRAVVDRLEAAGEL